MSKATEAVTKLIEGLPEGAQERIVEELRALIENTQDESRWTELIAQRKDSFIAAVCKALKDLPTYKATEMNEIKRLQYQEALNQLRQHPPLIWTRNNFFCWCKPDF